MNPSVAEWAEWDTAADDNEPDADLYSDGDDLDASGLP